jgi:hypothetical protein
MTCILNCFLRLLRRSRVLTMEVGSVHSIRGRGMFRRWGHIHFVLEHLLLSGLGCCLTRDNLLAWVLA